MTKKRDHDPRKFMELAFEVMRQSVLEPRHDGKSGPKVGAVLVKPDGAIETACRGELRHGDHAEFTLLERKNRSNKLDGSLLFATLEPCAPGAREPPKMSCAERIVLARIEEVWVGIEDPDPTVDRKGIKYLQDSGVTVHMFDRDLQETIRAENKDFIAQAMERAKAAAEKMPIAISLSPLERPLAKTGVADLSADALAEYRKRAKIPHAVGSTAFNRLLRQQGILEERRGGLIPTGFGFLLFGEKPRRVMHQAGLLAMIHYPGGEDERREFDEPMVRIPDLVEKWLKDKLPNVMDRSQMRRKERPALPYALVREGLVNALIHRDYDIAGAKCQLTVTEDTVTIRSPGRPPEPITIEQLQSFTAPMLSRNPVLHYVFGQMGLAEEQGLGIRTMMTGAERLGLPLPKYTWDDPYVVLTIYRTPWSASRTLPGNVLDSLNDDERRGWEFLATRTTSTRAEYESHMGIDKRKAQRHLQRFVVLGLLWKVGTGSATGYEVRGP
jgi:ATP-dependent DNA helicase RecG